MKRGLRFALVTCALFVLSTALEAQNHNRDKDKYAIIDCWSKRFITVGEENEYTNRVKEGKRIKWNAYGPENTVVKIVFKTNASYPKCHGIAPDGNANTRQETIGSSEHEKFELEVEKGRGGTVDKECYVYEVYCNSDLLPWESQATALDPIIEVPKR